MTTHQPMRKRPVLLAVFLSCATLQTGLLAAQATGRPANGWRCVETDSFRILSQGKAVSAEVAAACEALRGQLTARWLGQPTVSAWSPKCDLVLHATDAGYDREVGPGGRATLASAVVARTAGAISQRRIDVRAAKPNWLAGALGHELMHVIVADRFRSDIPAWADEGLAVLVDNPDLRQRHQRQLERAIATGTHFRLAELCNLRDYPAADRWGAFYGQSASLVGFLIELQGADAFLAFLARAGDGKLDDALRQSYGMSALEIERRWHAAVRRSGGRPLAASNPRPAAAYE